ncbi:MAG: translocation/assembly module TamB domain-containing protein [Persicimonas sp.]
MAKWLKRLGIALAIVIALVVLLVGLGLLFLQTQTGKDALRDRVHGALEESLAGEVDIGRIEGGLVTSMTLHDVRVYDERGNLAAHIPVVRADYAPTRLVGGELRVDSVTVEDPFVLARMYDDGTLNLSTIAGEQPPPEGEPSDFQISLEEATVEGGQVVYLDDATTAAALSEDERARISQWLDGLSDPDATPTRSADEIGELFEGDLADQFAGASLHGVDLEASAHVFGGGRLGVEVSRIRADARTTATQGTHTLDIEGIELLQSTEHLEVQLASARLESLARLSGLTAAVDFETERNEFDAPVAVGIEEFLVGLDEAAVEPRLVDAVAPDAPLTGAVRASMRIGGTETEATYTLEAGCGEAPNIRLSGNVAFPGQTLDDARYDLAATFDEVTSRGCVDLGESEFTTSGALVVDGEHFDPEELGADARFALTETTFDDFRLDALTGRVSARNGRFEVPTLRALTPYALVDARGEYDLSGEYSTAIDVDANEEVRRLLDELDGADMQTEFARLRLRSDGRLDPDADDPTEMVERTDTELDWNLRDFRLEEYNIDSSVGDVSAALEPVEADDGARRLDYDADVSARAVDLPGLTVNSVGLDARGGGRLALSAEDPLEALVALSTEWDLRLRGLRAAEAAIGRADLSGGLDRRGARGPFEWSVEGGIGGLRSGANRLDSSQIDLTGDAALEPADDTYELGRFAASGDASLGELVAGDARVGGADARLDVGGTLDRPTGTVSVDGRQIEVADESVEQLTASAGIDRSGRFEVDLRAERDVPLTLESTGRVDDAYRDFTFERLAVGSPQVELTLEPGARITLLEDGARFSDFRLESDDQFALIEGVLRSPGAHDVRVDIGNIQPEVWREGLGLEEKMPDVRGSVDASASIEGPTRWPDVDGTLEIRDFYYEDTGPVGTELAFTFAEDQLRVERLEATAFEKPILSASGVVPIRLDAAGNVDVPEGRQMEVHAEVPRLELEEFYEAFPILEEYDARGAIAAEIDASGTLDNPRLESSLSAEQLAVTGRVGEEYVEFDEVDTTFGLDYQPPTKREGGVEGRWTLQWAGDEIVDASLSTPVPLADWVDRALDKQRPIPDWRAEASDLPFEIGLRVDNLDLGDVPVETLAEADAEGRIRVDVRGSGTFSDPQIDADVALEDFGWDQFRDVHVDSSFRVDDQMLDIERLTTEWAGDEILYARGAVPLPTRALIDGEPLDDLPIDLTAQLQAMPISKLSPIDYDFARYEGTMAAFVEVGGTLSQPELDGRAGLFDTEASDGDEATVAVGFAAGEDRVDLEAYACRFYDDVLTATANLPINTNVLELARGASPLIDGELDGRIESDDLELTDVVPAHLLEDYVDELEGRLDLDVELAGTWEEPRATGEAHLREGAVTLPYYGRRFTDIELDLRASRDEIELAELSLRENETSLGAEGVVALEDLQPGTVDADFESDSFNLGGFVEGYDAYVTSDVSIEGDLDGNPGRVHAHADSLDVSLPETTGGDLHATELDEEIIVLERSQTRESLFDRGELSEGAAGADGADQQLWEVRFTSGRDSWVRHPNGDVEFTTDVTAEIGGPEVTMVGAVNTVRGDFEFLGKRFEVPEQENAVRFTGASPPNPQLDVRALYPVDRTIVQEMGDPTEGEPRIIVQVRGSAEEPRLVLESDPAMTETEIVYVLMTNRAPNQADAGEESRVSGLAMGAASGIFAGMLQQQLASSLPLDVIRVEAGEEGFRDARLQLGTYLTETVFVSYSYRFGAEEDEAQNIGKVEYRFAPRWSLETTYSDRLTGEFNIFWDVY